MITVKVERIGGTADLLLDRGTSVVSAVAKLTDGDGANHAVEVNDRAVTTGQLLTDGDRLSIVPTQVKGASA